MDPGEFDKRIEIVRPVQTGRDAAGAPIVGHAIVAQPWAKVSYPGGKEFLANSGTDAIRRAVFRVYPRDVDVAMKIRFAGVEWDIQDIRPLDDVVELHAVAPALTPAPAQW
mgnify:CR=1 FL=1